MNPFRLIFILLYSTITVSAVAAVRLPGIIGSHMVLQQNSDANIWGWCEPGEKISLKTGWDTAAYQTTGTSSATWNIRIKTPVATNKAYTISITGYNTITIEDILVGETWLCSGQSNMDMNINWGITGYSKDVAEAANNNIRFFKVARAASLWPQENIQGAWVVCSPETMKDFSAAGYFFGQQLQQTLRVPVGLIGSSWGGTNAETWVPDTVISKDPQLTKAAHEIKENTYCPTAPGACFNTMIYPLLNYNIAGVIWYQGESNVGTNSTYQQLFTSLITTWRGLWHQQLPFYFVQIAPYSGYGEGNTAAALLREAQWKTTKLTGTAIVPTIDLVDSINDIHPKLKKEVGMRLASCALALTYSKKVHWQSPELALFETKGKEIIVKISNNATSNPLHAKEAIIRNFMIAGADQKFYPAEATIINGNSISVRSNQVKKPVAVRYCFNSADTATIWDNQGLPLLSFRTDNWQ